MMKFSVENLRKISILSCRALLALTVVLCISCTSAPPKDTDQVPAEQEQEEDSALTPPPPPVMPPPPGERSEDEILTETDRRADAMRSVVEQQIATVVPGEYPTVEAKPKKKKKKKKKEQKLSYAKRTPRKPIAAAPEPPPVPVAPVEQDKAAPSRSEGFTGFDEEGNVIVPELELVERYNKSSGLPSNLVSAVYVDETEAWVGTSGGGVARYVFAEDNWLTIGKVDGLISNNVLDVIKYKGKVYVSTKHGISVWDGFSWISIEEKERVQTQNSSFTVNDGKLYIAARNMRGGLLVYDGKQWKNRSNLRPGSLLNNVSDMVFEGKDVWIGTTSRGLYAKQGKSWSSHTVSKGIASNFIYTLAVKEGKAYLGGCCGVSYFDGKRWVVYDVPEGLPHSTVNAIKIDGPLVWLGSKNGLSAFDGEEFHNFYTEDGLLGSNHVTNIYMRGDELWVGTTGGITRLKKNY